ncbi:hypothetical protein HNR60_002602 [Rhodopseudomonas rhenobacensis]|uniref:Uncharacterized protein n=1 Tax=Rhodopseudomonas rhenobacensis TaxID=87461 RepID=A0A7W7Z4H1_9BRAD|nr:hypothetical protein [Rhodopseudomonas rhenobacensis]MBB5047845.1 hypothetical protein [Rhodopseudomonas rhenobacensis]
MKLVRSLRFVGKVLFCAVALRVVLAVASTAPGTLAQAGAGGQLEERKLPMRFNWVACEPNCRGWISAVGIVTAETPKDFDDFARGRPLGGAAVVLDSSGGSVNDAITLGRRWRKLGLRTTVGSTIEVPIPGGLKTAIAPQAYCESMCVFLLLAGNVRYIPEGAHVRVHQIWMGDRADDARAASYTAQDMMIVERDIGRLAKFTFDMGGTGDLLSLALNVPPWENLHELSRQELVLTNLLTTEVLAELLPPLDQGPAVAELKVKPQQDRVASETPVAAEIVVPAAVKPTKTAEANLPTGGQSGTAAQPQR